MRRLLILLVGIVLFSQVPVWGQAEYPKAEVFGGFSVISLGGEEDFLDRQNALGWQASVAGNVHPNVGIVADFGGQYKTVDFLGIDVKLKSHEFLFGPRFNARSDQATGFVHALFGGLHASGAVLGESESVNGFMMGIGGGVDVNAGDRVAVRIVQFDWLPSRVEGAWSKSDVRFGFGIVFKSGS